MSRILTRREFAAIACVLACAPSLHALRRKTTAPAKRGFEGVDSLRARGAAIGLPVGCAVVPELLDLSSAGQDPYTRTIQQQAGILVAENAMKWSSLRPSPTTYDFTAADRLFQFAAQNGQLVRGHNLCWHEQLPRWFAAYTTRDNARQLLVEHIQTVAGRYAGRVHSWDVVNEAALVSDGRADGLRKSPWLELIGPEYIELAFATAAKADPQAKLTYNDYDVELDTPEQTAKRSQMLILLRRLHARRIPVQAVGIQSHLLAFGPRPGAGLVGLIREAAKMGMEAYVTEMDVNTRTLPGGPELQDAAVAEVYKSYLELLLPEPNLKAVLTWGVSHDRSWLNHSREKWALRPDGARQRPLPFDDDFQPTPAFFAMRSALDTGRQAVVPTDITAPKKGATDPYAPFAVPGSPGTAPLPPPQ
jgi:endo-1,4-beta-xylanase